LKFEGATARQAKPWLTRELHIVQPKLVVVMGEDALSFLNALRFPLSEKLELEVGKVQSFTPTIEALVVPEIDTSLDEQAAKSRFWSAFTAVGPWWSELPPY
jgi:uracil-DNA glycosylase